MPFCVNIIVIKQYVYATIQTVVLQLFLDFEQECRDTKEIKKQSNSHYLCNYDNKYTF